MAWTNPPSDPPPPSADKGGAFGPAGYFVKFGKPDEFDKSPQDETAKISTRRRASFETDAEEAEDNDWTVTYTDMVTLLMAFFVMLTSLALLEKNNDKGDPRPPTQQTEEKVAISPFEGMGITPIEGGMPANRDPILSRYDDPEEENSISDPSPSGHAHTGDPKPEIEVKEITPPSLPQSEAKSIDPAQQALAEKLQALVQQNNLGSQVQVVSNATSVTVRISDRILFQSGQARLEEAGQTLIARLKPMLDQEGSIISIEGHTDNIPISTLQFPSNWELSAARAATVLRQLVSLGLPANRLRAIAYADTKSVAENDSPSNRALNRRVELVISSREDE